MSPCRTCHLPQLLTLHLAPAQLQSCSQTQLPLIPGTSLSAVGWWPATQVRPWEGTRPPPMGSETRVLPVGSCPDPRDPGQAGRNSGPTGWGTARPPHCPARLPHPPLINGEIGWLIPGRRRGRCPVPTKMGPGSLSDGHYTNHQRQAYVTRSPSPRAPEGLLVLMDLPTRR